MRRQLPVHSPVTLAGLGAGFAGALGRADFYSLRLHIHSCYPARHELFTDSGTSALALALSAAAGDRAGLVALPAYACYDVATAADAANVRVVLYDVDPITLAPERESLDRALAQRPRAVVAVHLFGVPVDIERLERSAARVDAVVINDAAQAIGASLRGRPAGAYGALTVLSFGRGKGLTGGAGGGLLANDSRGESLLAAVRGRVPPMHAGWRELIMAAAQWACARPQAYGAIASLEFLRLGQTVYHPPRAVRGLSRASSRLVAALWNSAHGHVQERQARAARLAAVASASPCWRTIDTLPESTAGWLRLPLLARTASRAEMLSAAATRLGVMPGYPLPLSKLRGFRQRCVNADARFPGAEQLADCLLTVPTHRLLTTAELAALEQWLEEPFGRVAEPAPPADRALAHQAHPSDGR